jgi:hypothetical protein
VALWQQVSSLSCLQIYSELTKLKFPKRGGSATVMLIATKKRKRKRKNRLIRPESIWFNSGPRTSLPGKSGLRNRINSIRSLSEVHHDDP